MRQWRISCESPLQDNRTLSNSSCATASHWSISAGQSPATMFANSTMTSDRAARPQRTDCPGGARACPSRGRHGMVRGQNTAVRHVSDHPGQLGAVAASSGDSASPSRLLRCRASRAIRITSFGLTRFHTALRCCAMLGHRQVTDSYLVALARTQGEQLATFDRGLAAANADVALRISST